MEDIELLAEDMGKATGVAWVLGSAERPFDFGPSLTHKDWTVNEILAAGLPVSMMGETSCEVATSDNVRTVK